MDKIKIQNKLGYIRFMYYNFPYPVKLRNDKNRDKFRRRWTGVNPADNVKPAYANLPLFELIFYGLDG